MQLAAALSRTEPPNPTDNAFFFIGSFDYHPGLTTQLLAAAIDVYLFAYGLRSILFRRPRVEQTHFR